MTRRERIDTMREIRLWVGQIVVPGATLMTTLLTIPDVRNGISYKMQEMRRTAEEKKAYQNNSNIVYFSKRRGA